MAEAFLNQMQKLCQCEHTRMMHFHGFARIPQGQDPQAGKKDAECRANNCACKKYSPAEQTEATNDKVSIDM